MKAITTAGDIKQLGTILFVGAHPDDETFTAGGLLAAAAQNGQKVIVLTASRGEGGVQDEKRWPKERLGDIRTQELEAALQILGCTHHEWLDYKDGGCASDDPQRAIERIRELVSDHHVDTILTFGPDGLTGHPDHRAVYEWAKSANSGKAALYCVVEDKQGYEKYMAKADRQFNWYFNIENPPLKPASECAIALKLTPELRDIKLRALQAMPSQYEKFFTTVPVDLLEHLFTIECYVKA